MNVGELKRALERVPDDTEVFLCDSSGSQYWLTAVRLCKFQNEGRREDDDPSFFPEDYYPNMGEDDDGFEKAAKPALGLLAHAF